MKNKRILDSILVFLLCLAMVVSYIPAAAVTGGKDVDVATGDAAEETDVNSVSQDADKGEDEDQMDEDTQASPGDDIKNLTVAADEDEDDDSQDMGINQKNGNEEIANKEVVADDEVLDGSNGEGEIVSEGFTGIINNLPDNDELFEGYVNQKFGIEEEDSHSRKKGTLRRIALDSQQQAIYNYLVPKFQAIAAGDENSTTFDLESGVAGGSASIAYTAEQLNIQTLFQGNSLTNQAVYAISDKLSTVLQVIAAEMPYELYWYDKTELTQVYFSGDINDGTAWVCNLDMPVSVDYSIGNDSNTYLTDNSKTSATSTAVEHATTLINNNKQKLDYDKLKAYNDYICEKNTYNDEAAEEDIPYGNPWQLIYVFDEDPSTNVVCEGYSKAFQYLCSKSVWHDSTFSCISVDGLMGDEEGSGAHMWNIVTLGGKNYLADITNNDPERNWSGQLFLKGATSGNVDQGYVFSGDTYSKFYVYSSGQPNATTTIFDQGELTLSDTDYNFSQEKHTRPSQGFTTTATCEHDGVASYTCSVCTKEVVGEPDGPLGHNWNDPTWTWTEAGVNGYNATTTFVCSRDATHTIEAAATVTSQPSEDRKNTIYTATLAADDANNPKGIAYTEEKAVAVSFGATLTLEDNIDINLYVNHISDPSKFWVASSFALPQTNGKEIFTNLADPSVAHTERGYKIVIANVFPYQMTQQASIQVYYGDNLTKENAGNTGISLFDTPYSVKDYFENRYTNSEDELMKNLSLAGLNYGAMCQAYFTGKSYTTDGTDRVDYVTDSENPANSADFNTQFVGPNIPGDGYLSSLVNNIEGFTLVGVTLVLGTETSIKAYYNYSGDKPLKYDAVIANTSDTKTCVESVTGGKSNYAVCITGIRSFELSDFYTLTFTDENNNTATLTYSPYTYAKNKWNSGSGLASLVQSLVAYGNAADAYFNFNH